jgi:hypothetical protein
MRQFYHTANLNHKEAMMAVDAKRRSSPPQPLPQDEAFPPGRDPGEHAHPPEDGDFWENIVFENNAYKMEHYRAAAQYLANEIGFSVLLHYYVLPSFHNTGSTMMAAFIPADEGRAEQVPPAAHASKW